MDVQMYWSHSFFADLIRPDGVVFDFGVNNGGFARLVAPSCRRVIGFEPDPTWGGRLSLPPNVLVVPKAVASKSGTIPFHVNEGLCSSLHFAEAGTKTVEVEAVTLSDAMAIEPEGRIDLIKMDIEGEELAILNSAPADLFTRVVQMTVEFHDFLDPASVPAIRAVIARMEGMGFHAIRFSWNSYGDLLFINQRLVPLTMRQRAWVRLRHKYVRGAVRVMRRMLIL